jgi:hypothetical protein
MYHGRNAAGPVLFALTNWTCLPWASMIDKAFGDVSVLWANHFRYISSLQNPLSTSSPGHSQHCLSNLPRG